MQIAKVISFLFEDPADGKVSIQMTTLFFNTMSEAKEFDNDDTRLLEMLRAMGINAVQIITQTNQKIIRMN